MSVVLAVLGDVGGFLQQYNWSTWYNWITDEGGVKSYWLNQINRSITMHCFVLNTIQSLFLPSLVRIGWVFSENFEIIIQIRWRWICPILRMDYRICTTALMWQHEGKRKVGLPKTTWRMTVETERDTLGMNSWTRAKTVTKDRDKWKQYIRALCTTGWEEDRWGEVSFREEDF